MVIHLGAPLPAHSSNQPGSTDGPSLTLPYLVLLLVGFTWHPASPPDPVSSYLTLSPLPAEAGGLLSVALSLGLPPLDVIQHHALWSPDFPPPVRAAAIWSASAKLWNGEQFYVLRATFTSCVLCARRATGPRAGVANQEHGTNVERVPYPSCRMTRMRWQCGQVITSSARNSVLYSCGGRCMLHPMQLPSFASTTATPLRWSRSRA